MIVNRITVFTLSLLVVACALLMRQPELQAQDQPSIVDAPDIVPDSTAQWYDTIRTTRPRFARASLGERLALAAFTALALPVGIAVGGLTLAAPSLSMLKESEGAHAGLAIGTGWGFGGDTMAMVYYPDARVQIDVGYYLDRDRPFVGHASLLTDLRIASLHSRDFFWFALAGGAG